MQAIIMAGGRGERLRPLTDDRPKPLVEVFDRPVIDHVAAMLSHCGVSSVALTTHYGAEMLIEHARGWSHRFGFDEVKISREKTPMGTAGGVAMLHEWIEGPVIIASGDNLCSFDISPLVEAHNRSGASTSMALWHVLDTREFGIVGLSKMSGELVDESLEQGYISKFAEKPAPEESFSNLINAGIYLLEPDVVAAIPEGEKYDFSRDLFPLLLQKGVPMWAMSLPGIWYDVGRPSELIQSQVDVALGNAQLPTPDALDGVFSEGNWISNTARVEGDAILEGAVLHAKSFIGAGAKVTRSVVMRGAHVQANAVLEDALIVPEHALLEGHTFSRGVCHDRS